MDNESHSLLNFVLSSTDHFVIRKLSRAYNQPHQQKFSIRNRMMIMMQVGINDPDPENRPDLFQSVKVIIPMRHVIALVQRGPILVVSSE